MKEPVNNYTKQIEETSLRLAEKTQAIFELRERLAEIEAIETLEIINTKTPEGKPQFSNESTRNAELVIRLRKNQDAAELRKTPAILGLENMLEKLAFNKIFDS